MSISVVNIFLFKKKLSPGIPGFPGMTPICPVIPGYGKASELLSPSQELIDIEFIRWATCNRLSINTEKNCSYDCLKFEFTEP